MRFERLFRFASTGVLATLAHIITACATIEWTHAGPVVANGIAFCVATAFSYVVNTRWSFSHPLGGRNLVRFCTVSAGGLVVAMAVSGIAERIGLPYGLGIALVVILVPPVTFSLHARWTYGPGGSSDRAVR